MEGKKAEPSADLSARSWHRALWVLLVASVLVRITYLIVYASEMPLYRAPLVDAKIYADWARAIAAGDFWGRGEGVFYRAPLYPYGLAAIRMLTGDFMPAAAILQAAAGIGVLAIAALFARRIAGATAAFWATALLALYGPLVAAESKLLATIPGLFLHLLALWMTLCHADHPRPFRGALAGGMFGLAILIRPQWLALAAVVPFLFGLGIGRAWLHRWLWFALGIALVLGPVAVRNRLVGGDWVLISSNGGMTFYQGNNEENGSGLLTVVKKFDLMGSATQQRLLETKVAERETGRALKPSETSRFWTHQALEFIRTQPIAWTRLELRKLFRFITGYEYADNYSYYIERDRIWVLRFLCLPFGLLLAFGVAGLGASVPDSSARRLMLASAAAGCVGCLAFYVSSRYRMESVPALGVLGGVALARGSELLAGARGRVFLGAGLLLLVLSFAPPGAPARSQESITWLQLGNALESSKRPEEARAAYERSVALLPENLYAWNTLVQLTLRLEGGAAALSRFEAMPAPLRQHPLSLWTEGQLLAREGRDDAAIAALEQAIARNPLLKEAHFHLALLEEKAGRLEKARRHLEEAAELGDTTVELWSHLGYVRLQLRDYAPAREAYDELLAGDPDDDEARLNRAICDFYLGRRSEATLDFDLLSRRATPDPLLAYYRGLLALTSGDRDRASALLLEALDGDAQNRRALYYLAVAERGISRPRIPFWLGAYGDSARAVLSRLDRWFESEYEYGESRAFESSFIAETARWPGARRISSDFARFRRDEALPQRP